LELLRRDVILLNLPCRSSADRSTNAFIPVEPQPATSAAWAIAARTPSSSGRRKLHAAHLRCNRVRHGHRNGSRDDDLLLCHTRPASTEQRSVLQNCAR
jgi:hypothetical protein